METSLSRTACSAGLERTSKNPPHSFRRQRLRRKRPGTRLSCSLEHCNADEPPSVSLMRRHVEPFESTPSSKGLPMSVDTTCGSSGLEYKIEVILSLFKGSASDQVPSQQRSKRLNRTCRPPVHTAKVTTSLQLY